MKKRNFLFLTFAILAFVSFSQSTTKGKHGYNAYSRYNNTKVPKTNYKSSDKYYAYCIYRTMHQYNANIYISKLFDLSSLGCKLEAEKNAYGHQNLLEIYENCVKRQFYNDLKAHLFDDIPDNYQWFNPTVYIKNQNGTGCVNGDEEGCFMLEQVAEPERESLINTVKRTSEESKGNPNYVPTTAHILN